jgi:hypothetical protein
MALLWEDGLVLGELIFTLTDERHLESPPRKGLSGSS